MSATSILKWQSAPYPDTYKMLIDEACTKIITNDDGTTSIRQREDDLNLTGSNINILRYLVVKKYFDEEFNINYAITVDRDYKTEMNESILQKAHQMRITISKKKRI